MAWNPATFWASAESLPNAENAYTAASRTCSVHRPTFAARERMRRGAAASVVVAANVVIVGSIPALWRAVMKGDHRRVPHSSADRKTIG